MRIRKQSRNLPIGVSTVSRAITVVGEGTAAVVDQKATLNGTLLASLGKYGLSTVTVRQFLDKCFVFDGAAYTDHSAEADALGAEDLSGYLGNPDHLPGACLSLHPSLAVLVSDHAIVSLWAAHQGRGRIEEVDPVRPESALILREGDDVVVLPVGRGTAAFIAELTMAPLCAAAAAGAAKDPRFDLVQALAILIRHGGITAWHLPGDHKT